jgi:cell division protein FtsL
MVVGIVSVSALLVQGSFRVDELNGRISALQEEREVLTEDVAELSSPTRVQVWARQAGLVMPENVVVLRVPPVSTSSPGDAQG